MSANFSDCGKYRYRLDRAIGHGPPVAFLLHNPSTAGESADDQTSRRGISFARSLGFGRLTFINLWARIATKPRDLWVDEEPVGPLNDEHIARVAREIGREGGTIIGAWGRVSPPAARQRDAVARLARVLDIVRNSGTEILALAINKDGSPKHPLYVPKNATLVIWRG